MIVPADKGRAVVVLNTTDYKDKASELLSDEKTYKKMKSIPTWKYKTKLIKILQSVKQSGAITDIKYRQLYPTCEEVPKFYGLPKVHKPTCPLRPIVACRGSISYDIARFVADIISPLVGQSDYHRQNSKDLVNKLSDLVLDQDEVMVSYDVTALFTCTPVKESLSIIKERLRNDTSLVDRAELSVEQIMNLLEYCLTTTYFQYDGEFYQQLENAAMGSPVSPITANLFMEDFESKALKSYPVPPKFWGRYVDDTIVVIKKDQIDQFTDHINSQHSSIKFTMEREENGQIPVLDVLISRNQEGRLSFSVYRKPTHTEQYLNFTSHHPLQHKLAVIRTLNDRAHTIVSKEEDRQQEINKIRKSLAVCRYQEWTWNTVTRNKSRDDNRIPRRESARPLKTRLDEHARPSSLVGAHASFHDIDWDGVKELDREDNWYKRGVKEAINIRRTKSDLNKDQGRHHLPRTYDHLILSRDSRPSRRGHVTTNSR
ncbi:uncharacterized protein [Diadema antillarum]|uniref:uncharacterized protein n=1 Tax=Diadema antillarum TaxID=105358 RepID=UPI003A848D83